MTAPVSPVSPGPLNHGALAAAVRSGTPTLGTFIGMASATSSTVLRRGSMMPAAPASSTRPIRMRAADSTRTTVGTP